MIRSNQFISCSIISHSLFFIVSVMDAPGLIPFNFIFERLNCCQGCFLHTSPADRRWVPENISVFQISIAYQKFTTVFALKPCKFISINYFTAVFTLELYQCVSIMSSAICNFKSALGLTKKQICKNIERGTGHRIHPKNLKRYSQ